MRVGLDVRSISHGLTSGLRTYVLNLARQLPAAGPHDEFVFYADAKAPLELTSIPQNVSVRTMPWSSPLSTVINDRRLAQRMARDRVDIAHLPCNYGRPGPVPTVITLHDTLTLFPLGEQLRGVGMAPKRLATMTYVARAVRRSILRADRLIAPSEHAREDVALRPGIPLDRIDAIHEAADERFRPLENGDRVSALRARLRLPRHVILADGVKNADAVIRAYRALPEGLQHEAAVVFFSREPRPRRDVGPEIGTRIRFVPRPTTDDLVALFNLADVFVFPSWFEGFGLPLIEAMQCGAPVIGSTRGSIPEVIGGAGLLFDVEDVPALTRHLTTTLASNDYRSTLRQQSLARARAFSWRKAAELTLRTYRSVLTTTSHTV